MEQIVKRAIEGGYGKYKKTSVFMMTNQFLFDPLFWKALGRICKWQEMSTSSIVVSGWTYKKALRFHEINLTEGWEKAVEYLSELVK